MVVIDPGSGVPVYRQIVDQVRFQVAGGVLPPGTELPSTRVLAQELGINPMTVSKAYGLLEEAGLLERRPGLPLVVRDATPRTLAAERDAQLRAVLEPVARAVRQIGVEPEWAVRVFREVLEVGPEGRVEEAPDERPAARKDVPEEVPETPPQVLNDADPPAGRVAAGSEGRWV